MRSAFHATIKRGLAARFYKEISLSAEGRAPCLARFPAKNLEWPLSKARFFGLYSAFVNASRLHV